VHASVAISPAERARLQPGKSANALERLKSKSHFVRELLRQRLIGIACGYADGNDAAQILVRLDGGFAAGVFVFLEAEGCDYVVAMARNQRAPC
jgi:hypothetical protein